MIKVILEIIKDTDDNPNNEDHYRCFEESKNDMELYLNKYAKHGILPNIGDTLIGTNNDNTVSDYKVCEKLFSEQGIWIYVEWF